MIVAGFDIETTGLEIGEHRIIEIYLGLWDTDTGRKVGEFNQRINPERSIQAEAQRVHGISLADLVGCPVWQKVAPEFRHIAGMAGFGVAHNGAGFDVPFLDYELARVGLPPLPFPVVDTMVGARWATPHGKLPTLGELAFACDVPYDPARAHAADYDVAVMMQCWFRARAWGLYTDPDVAAPVSAAELAA